MEQFHRKFHVSLTFFSVRMFWKSGNNTICLFRETRWKDNWLGYSDDFQQRAERVCFSSNCSFKEIGRMWGLGATAYVSTFSCLEGRFVDVKSMTGKRLSYMVGSWDVFECSQEDVYKLHECIICTYQKCKITEGVRNFQPAASRRFAISSSSSVVL